MCEQCDKTFKEKYKTEIPGNKEGECTTIVSEGKSSCSDNCNIEKDVNDDLDENKKNIIKNLKNSRIVPGRYRHFKGNYYQVLNFAEDTETGKTMVVYKALYGERKTYVRELEMFASETDFKKYPEADQKYRFERKEKLVIIQGYMGAGKDFLVEELKKYDFEKVIGYTTRDMRPGETEGKEYNFVTNEQFKAFTKQLLASRIYQEKERIIYYGLYLGSVNQEHNQIVILDNLGTKQVVDYLGEENCEVFRLICKEEEILNRVINRQVRNYNKREEVEKIKKRLKSDRKTFKENFGYDFTELDTTKGTKKFAKKIARMTRLEND